MSYFDNLTEDQKRSLYNTSQSDSKKTQELYDSGTQVANLWPVRGWNAISKSGKGYGSRAIAPVNNIKEVGNIYKGIDAKKTAQDLLEQGKTPQEIWEKTKLVNDSGIWYKELDISKVTMNHVPVNKEVLLKDAINNHPLMGEKLPGTGGTYGDTIFSRGIGPEASAQTIAPTKVGPNNIKTFYKQEDELALQEIIINADEGVRNTIKLMVLDMVKRNPGMSYGEASRNMINSLTGEGGTSLLKTLTKDAKDLAANSFHERFGSQFVQGQRYLMEGKGLDPLPFDAFSNTIHEVQHLVQAGNKLPLGGSGTGFKAVIQGKLGELGRIHSRIRDLLNKPNLSESRKIYLEQKMSTLQNMYKKVFRNQGNDPIKAKDSWYLDLAGENQARAAQRRAHRSKKWKEDNVPTFDKTKMGSVFRHEDNVNKSGSDAAQMFEIQDSYLNAFNKSIGFDSPEAWETFLKEVMP